MLFNIRSVIQNEFMKILVFILWLAVNVLMFCLSYKKYCEDIQYFYLRKMLGESICISRATASALYFNCFLILLPICKSLLSWIRVLIQKNIKSVQRRMFNYNQGFHSLIGIAIIILAVTHTLSHCANCYRFYINFSNDMPELNISETQKEINIMMLLRKLPVWTGIVMLLILAVLAVGSLPSVRRSHFEIFWYSHHLAVIFFGLLIAHGFGGIVKHQVNVDDHYPGCEYHLFNSSKTQMANGQKCSGKRKFAADVPQAWKWVITPLIIYGIEKIVRFFSARKPVEVTKAIFHTGDVVELRMRKPRFSASPGQYIRLNCPAISRMEWHPFTLTECPSEYNDEFAVHIKLLGDWTALLASQLKSLVIVNENAAKRIGDSYTISMEDISPSSGVTTVPVHDTMLTIQVDGPYGSPFQDVSRFSVAVIITAGIGVTPFAALLNEMRYTMRHTKSYGKLKRLYFIWVCKHHDDLSWFLDILYRVNREMNIDAENEMLTTHLYVTRSKKLSVADPSFFDERKGWLSDKIRNKRPDWKKVFEKVDANHQSERIGVFFCGPKTIHPTLHRLCNKKRKNKNTFIFHKENF